MGPRPNLNEFLANRNLVALRAPAADLPGFFRKSFTVPLNCAALLLPSDGPAEYAAPGQKATVRGELLLAKAGPIELKMIFPDLRTADGFAVSATCAITVHLQTDRADLFRDLARVVLRGPGVLTTSDLKTTLSGELRRLLGDYAGGRPVGDLHRKPAREDWVPVFAAAMERHVFATGLGFGLLLDLSFASYDFEQSRAEEERRAEEARRSAERAEAKEAHIRRLEALLREEDIQALLNRIPDERVRSLVTATLMAEDGGPLTKETLVRRLQASGEDVRELLFRALDQVEGGPADLAALRADRAAEIFLATGDRVVQLDPAAAAGEPKVHLFPEPLRSARWAPTALGPAILAGGKGRVFVLPLSREATEPLEFPLDSTFHPRGGVNAVAVEGEWLFATHSEFGLARWNLADPGRPSERLFDEATARQRTTRGVCVADRFLVFATGSNVYRAPLDATQGAPEPLKAPASSPVTALTASKSLVFAGTADGAVVGWGNGGAEGSVVVRRKDPIVGLRVARLRRVPHVLYTAHDLAIHARVIGQNLETSYESGGITLSFMDAASDLLCAVDATGGRLLLWKPAAPTEPAESVDCWRFAQKPVLDVWMRKVAEG